MPKIYIPIQPGNLNIVNMFIDACNIKETFSPSMFNNLEILVSDTKDSKKTKLFDLAEDVRFFKLDPNDDTEFNKCDKNTTIVAQDYSVVPSVNDLEILTKEIDKDKNKCFWLVVEFEEVPELKKAKKSHVKSKAFKGLSKLDDEKAKAIKSDAMDEAKKIYNEKLIIETRNYRNQIKQLELALKKEQETSADLGLLLQKRNDEIASMSETKDNQIKTLTNRLKDVKKNTYTATQYNSDLAKERKKSLDSQNSYYQANKDYEDLRKELSSIKRINKPYSVTIGLQHNHVNPGYYQLVKVRNFTGAIKFNLQAVMGEVQENENI